MMTIGAFTGAAVGYFSGDPWLAFLCAGLAGMVFALIHGFACITCKADQTISGTAIKASSVVRITSGKIIITKVNAPDHIEYPQCK